MNRDWRIAAALGLAAAATACSAEPAVNVETQFVEWPRIAVEPSAPGSDDTIAGAAGAVPGGSVIRLFGDASGSVAIGEVIAAADGSFGPAAIGDNRWSVVWVQVGGEGDAGAYANDIEPPATTIDSVLEEGTADQQPNLAFSSSEPGSTFECGIDGAPWSPCTSPHRPQPVGHGKHAFRVRATDAAGNTGSPAYLQWSVALDAPPIRIDQAPPDPTTQMHELVRFSSVQGASFECASWLDDWFPCESPHQVAANDGVVQFQVRALLDGRKSDPVKLQWRVDSRGPEIERTQGPRLTDNDPNPVFAWTCEGGCGEVTCAIDGTPIEPCVSPVQLHDLADGDHQFDMTTRDELGNEGGTRWQWTIDTIPPPLVLQQAPPAASRENEAFFAFDCGGALCFFTCSLNGAEPQPCESPLLLSDLAEGTHRLQIDATDWVGNTAEPLVHEFVVDDTAPVIVFESTPEQPTSATTATFAFSCEGEPCTFLCNVDLLDPEPCTSPWTVSVEPGFRSVTLAATDRVGLAATTTWTWTITALP